MDKIDWLDSWRGIGCLMVFISHVLDSLFQQGSFFGKSGVAMLFILSAYLLCELYYWSGQEINWGWIKKFYQKRIIRIFPPLLCACAIAVSMKWMSPQLAVRQCLMLEQYSHFWVLPVEVGFYFIFPLIVMLMKKLGSFFSLIAGFVTIFIIWVYYLFFTNISHLNTFIYCFPIFILGIMTSLICHKGLNLSWGGWKLKDIDVFGCVLTITFEAFGLIVYSLLAGYGDTRIGQILGYYLEFFRFILGPMIFAFCLISIFEGKTVKKVLEKATGLQKLGRISYSFYLVHYIFLSTGRVLVLEYHINRLLILIFVFSLSIVIASTMHWLIEVQLSGMLRRILIKD